MIRFAHRLRPAFATVALFLLVAGCDGDDAPSLPPPPSSDPVPDFSLIDVNPNSDTGGQSVSPRQYLQKISAWYYGHAT